MRLLPSLGWLVDEAGAAPDAGQFLATLGAKLIADGVPLAGGALTLTAPHPIVARRTWLWRAETDTVIEALGFAAESGSESGMVGRDWLARLGAASLATFGPALAWAVTRGLGEGEEALLHEAARFATAPLAALTARAAMAALLEAYLGRRGAAQVLAGRSRREPGETIRAALLVGDLRGFTELSETLSPQDVVTVLDSWFDCVAGAVHAFGGEVLKFIGDGVLAIFPIGHRSPAEACDAALSAVGAARAGMAHLNRTRGERGLPALEFGLAIHFGEISWGNVGAADRLDFTAIGPAVNLVSRLQDLCRPLGRTVLATDAVAAHAGTPLIPLGKHGLRGIAAACAIFAPADA